VREHQTNAINKFEEHYYKMKNSRGILSMCCGSGKTYTFYGIMKNCINKHNDDLFIYATSRILLVKGIIKDIIKWVFFDKLDIEILVKVSDFKIKTIESELKSEFRNNVEFDEFFKKFKNKILLINYKGKDLGTITEPIKSRYSHKNILIITTHNGMPDIVNAISKYNAKKDENSLTITPNLLTIDESHNLAGTSNNKNKNKNKNKTIAKSILDFDEDKHFDPDKYLFMTATPLKVIKRNPKSGYNNDETTFSMSNTNIFGDIFFEYTFWEGINNSPKCIVDFDIIYLDDSKYMTQLNVDIKNKNKIEKQIIYFNVVSNLLLKIIEKKKLKHILLYLSNTEKLKDFYSILEKNIKDDKRDETLYMMFSGKGRNKLNEEAKKQFEEESNNTKILLSVAMLNEGIDIPIIDSVMFIEEKQSETVIVQNIGRALRLHKNKKKAHIILPTKIYERDNEYEPTYSSTFKKIRDICDKLKTKPDIDNKYYTRKANGDTVQFKNPDNDENINEKSGLVDKIIKINDDTHHMQSNMTYDVCKSITSKIIDTLDIKSSSCDISNINFDKIKKIIQGKNIINLYQLNNFLTEIGIIQDKLHNDYKSDWKCYGDLLFNKIYSFQEAIDTIKLLDLSHINSPKDWNAYYYNIIENDLKNECIFNKILYIPYDPKTYYLEEWEDKSDGELYGWCKFLGKKLDVTGYEISNPKASSIINAESNLRNIINNDAAKVVAKEWTTFNCDNNYRKEIKKYIDDKFKINSIIQIRYIVNKDKAYDKFCINVRPNDFPIDKIPPIIIYSIKKIKFDKDIYNIDILLNKKKIDRTEEEYIYKNEINTIIDNIQNDIKKHIKRNI
jgi:predicted helicase